MRFSENVFLFANIYDYKLYKTLNQSDNQYGRNSGSCSTKKCLALKSPKN